MNSIEQIFKYSRRVVIKVGSSLLADGANSAREDWLKTLASDISRLRREGKQVVVVSSGAVGLGRGTLKYANRKLDLEEKRAAAACGQITLISCWAKAFQSDGNSLYPAQILLTLDDSESRRRYLNARNTFKTLLAAPNIIPIVNENDSVATEELRVGDNDRLAARVAQMIGAELLILLSDVDGLYTANPVTNPAADYLYEVRGITEEIEAMGGGVGSSVASGGMRTKIEAAKIALAAGSHMIISRGTECYPIKKLIDGERCTLFYSDADPKSARKQWILGSLQPKGSYLVDAGAREALFSGKSLLPAGVSVIHGSFERGDAVVIEDHQGKLIGKGLSEYSSSEATKILGAKSTKIGQILGYKYRDVLVHRDDLVLEATK
jgi:glutamate 5-kinase